MNEHPKDDQMLNAYVDGELSQAEAAEVARAAASDPAIAARIAVLRELKAAVADIVPPAHLAMPRPSLPRRRVARVAAVLAGIAAIMLFGFLITPRLVELQQRPDWPSVLEAHHRSWAFSLRAEGPPVRQPVGLPGELLQLDLSAARLALVGHERIEYRDLTVDRVGYAGTRGCRLSLFRLPVELKLSEGVFVSPFRVRLWQEERYVYLLMAEGMAETRFGELAAAIERALRDHAPFDAETQQRLAAARAKSLPCQA